jgi:hypothetical protein
MHIKFWINISQDLCVPLFYGIEWIERLNILERASLGLETKGFDENETLDIEVTSKHST